MLRRRTVLTSGLTAGLTAGVASSATLLATEASGLTVGRTLARGLDIPWGLAFLPDGDALVTERRSGDVHRVSRSGGRRQVGTIGAAADFGEGGLLGVAVGPTFARDRWVYFYLTTARDNRIIRKRYVGGELGRTHVLLSGIARSDGHGSRTHHGGRLAFGPSGHLFASTGDAARPSRSQDDDSLNGKILRLNPNGSVPADNPVRGNPMWSKGHRNVQGLAWDGRGRMWATELGQSRRDELNIIRKGRNYGWPDVEGGDRSGPYADPFVVWSPTSTCSPSGLAIAKGRAWVGALAGEALLSVRISGARSRRKARHFHQRFGRIRTVEQAPDGSLWVTTSNGGDDRVIRLRI